MSAVPQQARGSARSVGANQGHGLKEDRYWGIQAALEQVDGRLAREDYCARLAGHAVLGLVKISSR